MFICWWNKSHSNIVLFSITGKLIKAVIRICRLRVNINIFHEVIWHFTFRTSHYNYLLHGPLAWPGQPCPTNRRLPWCTAARETSCGAAWLFPLVFIYDNSCLCGTTSCAYYRCCVLSSQISVVNSWFWKGLLTGSSADCLISSNSAFPTVRRCYPSQCLIGCINGA